MMSILLAQRTQVQCATIGCALVVSASLTTALVLSPTLLVPFLGLITLPLLLACLAVLLYAIPSLIYLLLAQTAAPRHTGLLFLPLNPVRNIGIIRGVIAYIRLCAEILPVLVWNTARYLILERIIAKAGDFSGNDVGELWDGFAVFGITYAPHLKLDIYLLPPTTLPFARPRAPDIDGGSSAEADSEGALSPSPVRGKPVIVFIYDVGMMGPIRPRRWMFALLGAKLAAMGYVLVIPDIGTYPPTDARGMVLDLRRVLRWVKDHIRTHNGDPTQIHILSHGLGAHLSLYTIAQQNIITSLRKRDLRRSKLSTQLRVDRDSDCDSLSYFSPEAPMSGLVSGSGSNTSTPRKGRGTAKGKGKGKGKEKARLVPGTGFSRGSGGYGVSPGPAVRAEIEGDEAEDGLREMGIYGEEIEIPIVKGMMLLAPVTDVIKQIKHESTSYLEHISPVRRILGPTQKMCMRHSLGHLLFAGKGVLDPRRMPKVMIIHGAQDTITPLDHAHWLHELLHGLDVNTVFRPYRNMTHWGGVEGLMLGSKGEYTDWLEKDVKSLVQAGNS